MIALSCLQMQIQEDSLVNSVPFFPQNRSLRYIYIMFDTTVIQFVFQRTTTVGVSDCVEDSLVVLEIFLFFFCRVVDSLKHSTLPVLTLFSRATILDECHLTLVLHLF